MIARELYTYEPATEANPEDLSQVAFEMFINASLACPASITAQGAWIALEIVNRFGNNVSISVTDNLKQALINDAPKLRLIANAADSQHRKKGRPVSPLTSIRVGDIVRAGFGKADTFFRVLPDDQLKELVESIYPYFHSQMRDVKGKLIRSFPEDSIAEAAENMVHGREMKRPWRDSNPQP